MTQEEQERHDAALAHYRTLIASCGVDVDSQRWCLHHVDATMRHRDPARYHEWRIEDVVPLTVPQHSGLHMRLRNPKGRTKTKAHVAAMIAGRRKERRACNVLIYRLVSGNGAEGVEAYAYPSCSAAARHIGCSKQLVYQVASKTQQNRRAMGWNCSYVPKSVSLGRVAGDMLKSLVG